MSEPSERVAEAAVVLCGGFSRRMGREKWSLPFGDENLLERTVRIVGGVVSEVVVVAREGQDVDGPFRFARDPAEGLGPLAGLVAGLEATDAERVFLISCDSPFLAPALVRRLLDLSRGFEIVMPMIAGFQMSTTAVYSKAVLPTARALIAERRLRPVFLAEPHSIREVTEAELRDVDPELASFQGCNTPEEYERALLELGD
ncbi:MAG: molybdenum cofactor guanylyltransferase [Planctomycetota bacterium]